MSKFLVFLNSLILFFPAYNVAFTQTKNADSKETKKRVIVDMDSDLEGYPDYYKKRVLAFRTLIRTQKTPKLKISKAISILNDDASPYRKDAISFLTEVKAKDALPALLKAGEYKELRPDVAFSLGDMRDKRSVEFLLRCLYDENENVRGNAVLSLRKLTKMQFGYDYSDEESSRKKAALLWESWWARTSKNLVLSELSQEERDDADQKWEKYGKKHIERILNE